jgi:hypothetical protein
MIWSDLGRAALLALIPLAAFGGWLSLPLLLLVTLLTAVLTTFFDTADNAFLPTIVPRADLVRANGALAASGSVSEFAAFGSAGFLVQILTAPVAILVDAFSFIVSAVLLGSIRTKEAPPPDRSQREPVLREIALGLRLVAQQPILRALTLASMASAAMWGVFGALWYLFAIEDLSLDAAAIGIVAAVGGVSSLFGALLTTRLTGRFGVGRVLLVAMLVGMLGSYSIPLAPVGAPLIAMLFLIGQQLITDPAMTAFDITDTSLRQTIVHDRQLGRVNATVRVAILVAQLAVTLAAGFLALQLGIRAMLFKRLDEVVRRELQKVVHLLAHAHEEHRHTERVLDRERDAAARGGVELRQGDASQPCGLVEGARLGQAVLAGCRVEDEEHLGLCVREPLANRAPDLGQLLHQV